MQKTIISRKPISNTIIFIKSRKASGRKTSASPTIYITTKNRTVTIAQWVKRWKISERKKK
ncbi:MAG: hypothetical protein M9949_12610 [Candidatus Kapabacteria bacterium]|nr:hypothetical protein [Candidatus Kapabacteria bacterium]